MIVCSCNIISDSDIRRAIKMLVNEDPDIVLTPGRVYKALGKRAKCGVCLQNTISIILEDVKKDKEHHAVLI